MSDLQSCLTSCDNSATSAETCAAQCMSAFGEGPPHAQRVCSSGAPVDCGPGNRGCVELQGSCQRVAPRPKQAWRVNLETDVDLSDFVDQCADGDCYMTQVSEGVLFASVQNLDLDPSSDGFVGYVGDVSQSASSNSSAAQASAGLLISSSTMDAAANGVAFGQ